MNIKNNIVLFITITLFLYIITISVKSQATTKNKIIQNDNSNNIDNINNNNNNNNNNINNNNNNNINNINNNVQNNNIKKSSSSSSSSSSSKNGKKEHEHKSVKCVNNNCETTYYHSSKNNDNSNNINIDSDSNNNNNINNEINSNNNNNNNNNNNLANDEENNEIEDSEESNSYYSASKHIDGVDFYYTNNNGAESLDIKGIDSNQISSNDRDRILEDFRKALNIEGNGIEQSNYNYDIGYLSNWYNSFVSQFRDIFTPPTGSSSDRHLTHTGASNSHYNHHHYSNSHNQYYSKSDANGGAGVYGQQQYDYDVNNVNNFDSIYYGEKRMLTDQEKLSQQLDKTMEELFVIDQQEIELKKRVSDINIYYKQIEKNPSSKPIKTIEELVEIESERLYLLEKRLKRVRQKLLSRKEVLSSLHQDLNSYNEQIQKQQQQQQQQQVQQQQQNNQPQSKQLKQPKQSKQLKYK